jgi:cytochrome c biogenesis protein CcdA
MTLSGFGLAFLAGLLSVLSPCVLPLLPIVLGAAASEHRLGQPASPPGLRLRLSPWDSSSRQSAPRSDWTPEYFVQPPRS